MRRTTNCGPSTIAAGRCSHSCPTTRICINSKIALAPSCTQCGSTQRVCWYLLKRLFPSMLALTHYLTAQMQMMPALLEISNCVWSQCPMHWGALLLPHKMPTFPTQFASLRMLLLLWSTFCKRRGKLRRPAVSPNQKYLRGQYGPHGP